MIDKATLARAHAWRRGWEDGACGRGSRVAQEMDENQEDYAWGHLRGAAALAISVSAVRSLYYPGLTMADFDLMWRIG